MSFLTLTQQDATFVLTLTHGAAGNVLNDAMLAALHEALDHVERSTDDAALVITSDDAKCFSNGIDLPWLTQQPDPVGFIKRLEDFYIRLGLLNLPVIAAINGNAYAGGALIATCADLRLMRADRGRFCYSEVKVRMPFTPALIAIVNLLPEPEARQELALTGNAWGGEECARRRVVHQAVPATDLLPASLTLAADLATRDRPTYAAIKRGLRAELVQLAQQRGLACAR